MNWEQSTPGVPASVVVPEQLYEKVPHSVLHAFCSMPPSGSTPLSGTSLRRCTDTGMFPHGPGPVAHAPNAKRNSGHSQREQFMGAPEANRGPRDDLEKTRSAPPRTIGALTEADWVGATCQQSNQRSLEDSNLRPSDS